MKYYPQLKTCYTFDPKEPKLDYLSYHNNTQASRRIEDTMRDWAFRNVSYQLEKKARQLAFNDFPITKKEYKQIENNALKTSSSESDNYYHQYHRMDKTHPNVVLYNIIENKLYNTKHKIQNKLHKEFKENFKFNIFDNTKIKGFKILSVQERYSTSNKVFRIQDPRGFIVEIPANNLCEIAINGSIKNGAIQDECIWLRNGSNNWLVLANDPDAIELMDKTKK